MGPRRLIAMLTLAVLALAGCGGGEDSSTVAAPVQTTEPPPALSKEELISQGDAICAEVNAAVGTVSSSSADSASQVAQEADLYGGMVERLKDLGTPDDTEGYPEFIAAADELAQAESDAELASERGDEGGLVAAQETASSARASFQAAADEYGFEECGESPSAPGSSAAATAPSSEAVPSEGVGVEEEVEPSEPEPAPETGGAGSAPEEAAPPSGGGTAEGSGGGTSGGSSGGIGPG